MGHDHHHHDQSSYYLEQLFTIAICGMLGAVACLLWLQNKLSILTPNLRLCVLAGGVGLLVLVVIRAVAVWSSVAEPQSVPVHDHDHCGHDHDHCGHDHGHGHAHAVTDVPGQGGGVGVVAGPHTHTHEHEHEHSHEHGHDHGWAPWRYVLLLLPVVLFFLNLNPLLSATGANVDWSKIRSDGTVVDRGGGVIDVGFQELEEAARSADRRAYYQGKTARLTGQYAGDSDSRFALIRFKINCCAADAVPLKSVIMLDPKVTLDPKGERLPYKQLRGKWVEVTGLIQFLQQEGTNDYVTALILRPTTEKPLVPREGADEALIQVVPQDSNPYLY
jgi:hypothetical protein